MIAGGYILQPRKVDSSGIMQAPPVVRELWLYLLRKVNHKDNGTCKRGEGFFRLEDIQNDLRWYVGYRKMTYSKPQLTKSLRRLREGNAIATTKATRGVRVTVLNYDLYQNPKNYESNDETPAKEARRKSGGRTINKNEERMKEVKNPLTPPEGEACPYQKIIKTYHEQCTDLPRVNVLTPSLEKNIKARWQEQKARQDITWWQEYFAQVAASDYLTGRVKAWRADFPWLMGPVNMTKVLNDAYKNTQKKTRSFDNTDYSKGMDANGRF